MSADRELLSPTMSAALTHARSHGGSLVRQPGGFWVGENHATTFVTASSQQTPYFGTKTVQALVSRKAAHYTEWKDGRGGRFPVRMTVGAAA